MQEWQESTVLYGKAVLSPAPLLHPPGWTFSCERADCAGPKGSRRGSDLLPSHKSSTVAHQAQCKEHKKARFCSTRMLGLGLLMSIWMLVMLIWILWGGIPHFAGKEQLWLQGDRQMFLEQPYRLLPQGHICHAGTRAARGASAQPHSWGGKPWASSDSREHL